MAKVWKNKTATEHIERKLKDVETVTIQDYTRDTSLANIPTNKAYSIDAVHLYADILNMDELLDSTDFEGETTHKRTLRFLNLHYRAAHRVMSRCNVTRVDFHNQRLHAIVSKPYNSETDAEAKRICKAVAVGQLLIDVLAETGSEDDKIPDAKVRVGIDSGIALAVNNGRRGGREPLFLGEPANHAAKMAGGGAEKGIFLTNTARSVLGLDEVDEPNKTALTSTEIEDCQTRAALEVSKDTIIREWREDLDANPIGSFVFKRHTPPLRTMDITTLTPGNSRRQEAVSMYADIDGFTAFVGKHIVDNAEDVVRVLHVIRAELDRVLTADFDGRRIRFVGDCIHGLLCDGTAQTTDEESSVSTATLCAGALRSSFDLALDILGNDGIDVTGLGLAIGFDLGQMTVTRLGMHGDRVRCSISRGVLRSEAEQCRCDGDQSAIGQAAYDAATEAVQKIFGDDRIVSDLDYNEALEAMASKGDATAKAARMAAIADAPPAVARSFSAPVTPYSD